VSMRMIYLIGVKHKIQYSKSPNSEETESQTNARNSFKEYIWELITTKKPALVAEEFNEQVLEYLKSNSHVKEIADELNVEHRFCEPSSDERVEMGVPGMGYEGVSDEDIEKFHKLREEFWMGKITENIGGDVLYICGANHIQSFKFLLESNNHNVVILEEYYAKEAYDT